MATKQDTSWIASRNLPARLGGIPLLPVLLAHRDPSTLGTLQAALQSQLGLFPEIGPSDPEALRTALGARGGGWVLLDIDLVAAVVPLLRQGPFHLVAIIQGETDPRTAKLTQWGAAVVQAAHLPAYLANFMEQLSEGEEMPAPPVKHSADAEGLRKVVLHSAKGGVGTSTLAVHLATTWARQGLRVALVDLAPYGAAAVLCKAQQKQAGMEAFMAAMEAQPELLSQTDLELSRYFTPLLSQPGRLDLMASARPRVMDRLKPDQVESLLARMDQLPYDRIVIDTSTEATARNLAALAMADQILLVCSPDFTCAWNLILLQEMLDLLAPRGQRLVALNRTGAAAGMSASDLSGRLKLPVIASIPEDGALHRLNNQGVPWELGNDSTFLQAVIGLAGALDEAREALLYG